MLNALPNENLLRGLTAIGGVLGLNFNTVVVLCASVLLGLCCGLSGSFLLLRKRALLSDVIGHGTLPGLCLAFLLVVAWGGEGRSFFWLFIGALGSGTAAIVAVNRLAARLHEDAALAVVLSSGLGLGTLLLSIIQELPVAGQAGLDRFLLGHSANLLASDLPILLLLTMVICVANLWLHKNFALLCFDPNFAASLGWPLRRLDFMLTLLCLVVVCLALPLVGLILVVALMIIPAATARLLTKRTPQLQALAALLAAISAGSGALLSTRAALPTGGSIVLVAASFFVLSLVICWARDRRRSI